MFHPLFKWNETDNLASRVNDLQEAIHKADLLREENQSRWPPNNVASEEKSRLSLWGIGNAEAVKEENSQMAQD